MNHFTRRHGSHSRVVDHAAAPIPAAVIAALVEDEGREESVAFEKHQYRQRAPVKAPPEPIAEAPEFATRAAKIINGEKA